MKFLIYGIRNLSATQETKARVILTQELKNLNSSDTILLSKTRGISTLAKFLAGDNEIPVVVKDNKDFLSSGPRGASLLRDRELVSESDAVFVFWDKICDSTRQVIKYAKHLKKPLRIIYL